MKSNRWQYCDHILPVLTKGVVAGSVGLVVGVVGVVGSTKERDKHVRELSLYTMPFKQNQFTPPWKAEENNYYFTTTSVNYKDFSHWEKSFFSLAKISMTSYLKSSAIYGIFRKLSEMFAWPSDDLQTICKKIRTCDANANASANTERYVSEYVLNGVTSRYSN